MIDQIIFALATIAGARSLLVPDCPLADAVVSTASSLLAIPDTIVQAPIHSLEKALVHPEDEQRQQSPPERRHGTERYIFDLYVRTFGTAAIYCEKLVINVTVKNLKNCIETKTGMKNVRLVFNGTELSRDNDELRDDGVRDEAVVNAVQEDAIFIYVKKLGDRTSMTYQATPTTTIGELKKMIATRTGMTPEDFRLSVYDDCNELQDSHTLRESGIETSVLLVLRIDGESILAICAKYADAQGDTVCLQVSMNVKVGEYKMFLEERDPKFTNVNLYLGFFELLQDDKSLSYYMVRNGTAFTARPKDANGYYLLHPNENGCVCEGKAILIFAKPSDTIGQLLQEANELGLSTNGQRATFNGYVLNNNETLADYGIQPGSGIALTNYNRT